MKLIAPLQIGKPDQDWTLLRQLYSRKDIFGVNLYEIGIGERIESLVRELFASYGAVRKTLHKYVKTR
jgi:fructuronate reductase